jgi:hypothetical protein
MDEMFKAIQPEFDMDIENPPTLEVEEFFRLLKASEEPLHEHTKVTLLTFVIRLLKLIRDVLPNPYKLPKDMYHSKKLVKGLGMDYEKIDVC